MRVAASKDSDVRGSWAGAQLSGEVHETSGEVRGATISGAVDVAAPRAVGRASRTTMLPWCRCAWPGTSPGRSPATGTWCGSPAVCGLGVVLDGSLPRMPVRMYLAPPAAFTGKGAAIGDGVRPTSMVRLRLAPGRVGVGQKESGEPG